MRSFIGGIVALALAGFAALACSTALDAGADDAAPRSPSPGFTNADADAAVVEAEAFTSYCPSNKCPAGHTSCPTSRFPCDVNLQTDRGNCGACGVVCPMPTGSEYYECIDGRCVMQCNSYPLTLDCDGIPDNGCESVPSSKESCGGCGIVCTDPAKPCINRNPNGDDWGCGCKGINQQVCQGQCVDTSNSDFHCGACGNSCPREVDGAGIDPSLHMYYGCVASKCGRPKCDPGWADCDGDPGNGCETNLVSEDNCASCGNACAAGQQCARSLDTPDLILGCMCPPGLTFCGWGRYGSCVDTTSDSRNCGGCDIFCIPPEFRTTVESCVAGMCKIECTTGRADCNGNAVDGCEVNIDSDPRNCGGCGIVCDAIAGQACVQGRCVVEPCDEAVDAGRGPQ
jgi:hypothetical protein